MAQGTAHQGAWEGIAHQGAWELQSHEYQDTLADSITLSDALAAGVSVSLADTIDIPHTIHDRSHYFDCQDLYYGRLASSGLHDVTTLDIGIAFAVRVRTNDAAHNYVMNKNWSNNGSCRCFVGDTGHAYIGIKDTSGNEFSMHINQDIRDGGWHFVLFIIDRSGNANCTIYIDGAVAASIAKSGDITTLGTCTNSQRLAVGASSNLWSIASCGIANVAIRQVADILAVGEMGASGEAANLMDPDPANWPTCDEYWEMDEGSGVALSGSAGNDLTANSANAWIASSESFITQAGISLADTMSGADSLQADASTVLADTISLNDLLAAGTQFFLADSITLTDALISAASRTLADNMSISEQLATKVIVALADGISLADALTEIKPHITLGDTISLIDAIQQATGTSLADTINLSDAIQAYVDEELDDGIGMTDSLVGVLIPGLGPASVVSAGTLSGSKSPRTWRMAVGSVPRPITYIAQTSENTAYTKTSVSDSDAWDLTGVSRADIVITGDGFQGRIESVGVNSIIVDGWWKGGANLDGRAESIPADGQGATVHHSMQAKRVLIRAGKSNTSYIYAGMSRTVGVDSGHPIGSDYSQPNSALRLEAPLDRWLNMCNVWLMANSNQEAVITPKAFRQVGMGGVVDLGPDHPIFNDCVLDGNFLYVAIEDVSEGGGVLVYNVADPTNPVRMNYLSVTNVQAEAPMRIIRHSGHLYSAWETGVRVIRAPSPSGMSQIADITRPAASGWPATCAAYGDRLWCQGLNTGLGVYNISDPASPAHVGGVAYGHKHFGPEVGGTPPSTKHPYYSYPYGGYGAVFQTYQWVYATAVGVFCATMGPYWQFTLSDAPILVHVHSCAVGPHGGSTPVAHAALGDVLYSHNAMGPLDPDYGYMRIAANAVLGHGDIGVIAAPIEHYGKFVVSGGIGYIVTNGRIAIVNLTTGILQSFISGTYRGADVGGNYLYATQYEIVMGSPNHHIDVYDISNPASPVLVGTGA